MSTTNEFFKRAAVTATAIAASPVAAKLSNAANTALSRESNAESHEQKLLNCITKSIALTNTVNNQMQKLAGGAQAGLFGAGAKPEAIKESQVACENALPKLQALQPGASDEKEMDDSNQAGLGFAKVIAAL